LLIPSLFPILKSLLKNRRISTAPAFTASISMDLNMSKDNKPLFVVKNNKLLIDVRELLFLTKS